MNSRSRASHTRSTVAARFRSVAIAGPICSYRQLLLQTLAKVGDYTPIDLGPGEDLAEQVACTTPDVLILQLTGCETAAASRRIAAVSPRTHVVAISEPLSADDTLLLIESGIVGIVFAGAPMEDLLREIEAVLRGEANLSPSITGTLVRRLGDWGRGERGVGSSLLSPREIQIVRLLADGLANKEIAAALNIGVGTVKTHVHRLLEKLEVHHRCAAVERARSLERSMTVVEGGMGRP